MPNPKVKPLLDGTSRAQPHQLVERDVRIALSTGPADEIAIDHSVLQTDGGRRVQVGKTFGFDIGDVFRRYVVIF